MPRYLVQYFEPCTRVEETPYETKEWGGMGAREDPGRVVEASSPRAAITAFEREEYPGFPEGSRLRERKQVEGLPEGGRFFEGIAHPDTIYRVVPL